MVKGNLHLEKLDALFAKQEVAAAEEKRIPKRPCGCATWFLDLPVCPYCGKKTLKGVIAKPAARPT